MTERNQEQGNEKGLFSVERWGNVLVSGNSRVTVINSYLQMCLWATESEAATRFWHLRIISKYKYVYEK